MLFKTLDCTLNFSMFSGLYLPLNWENHWYEHPQLSSQELSSKSFSFLWCFNGLLSKAKWFICALDFTFTEHCNTNYTFNLPFYWYHLFKCFKGVQAKHLSSSKIFSLFCPQISPPFSLSLSYKPSSFLFSHSSIYCYLVLMPVKLMPKFSKNYKTASSIVSLLNLHPTWFLTQF